MLDINGVPDKPGRISHYRIKDAALNVRDATIIAASAVPITLHISTGVVLGVPIFGSYWLARKAICAWRVKPCDYDSPFLWTQRVGANGELIDVLKFRTMRDISSDGEHRVDGKSKNNADREIRVMGTFFRKTGLDEVLQIFNIVKGEMTFPGSMRPKTITDWLGAAGLKGDELESAVTRFNDVPKSNQNASLFDFMDELLAENKLSFEWVEKIKKVLSIKPSIVGWSQVDRSIDRTPENPEALRQMINRQIEYMGNPQGKRKDMYLAAFKKVISFACDGRKRKSSSPPSRVRQPERVPVEQQVPALD